MLGPKGVNWVLAISLYACIYMNNRLMRKDATNAIIYLVDVVIVSYLQVKLIAGLRTWYYNGVNSVKWDNENEEETDTAEIDDDTIDLTM